MECGSYALLNLSLAGAYNLIGTGGSGGLTNTNGNQVGVVDPDLGPLAYYGGPTQTIALLPGSPAIDAGSNALAVDPSTGQPLTTDQRGPGFVRIYNGTVDIGAYEFSPPPATPSPSSGDPSPRRSRPPPMDCGCSRRAARPTCPGWESTACRSPSARLRR